ncbi:hypothetical protein JD79_00127 [Geodermatophilus normandii]|uniref:Uncharacterized protein n=1 Tax=Geodermatophilus normandii TaxID=1137989 RepID=A0A317QDM7_9ACTN|nr:hypothetical protein JD79_00127 [Geodermatophilus normandii]
MLDPVAELAEHVGGDVGRLLGDEEDADALGPDEPHRLGDRREERLAGAGEEQVRLVEEEHDLRRVEVADLGQLLEQLGEQPHQEGGEQRRPVGDGGQLDGADDAAAVGRGADQVGGVERGLAEEDVAAEVLQRHELAQHHPRRRLGQPAEAGELLLALPAGQPGEQRAQVGEVQQREARLVGVVEDQAQRALLGGVEAEHLGQQGRAEVADRGPHRHAGAQAAECQVLDGEARGLPGVGRVGGPAGDPLGGLAGAGQPRQVSLEVGEHHRDSRRRQLLGHELQGAGLAGAGRPGDEPVPVEHGQRQPHLRVRVRPAADGHRAQVECGALHGVARRDPGGRCGGPVGGRVVVRGGGAGLAHAGDRSDGAAQARSAGSAPVLGTASGASRRNRYQYDVPTKTTAPTRFPAPASTQLSSVSPQPTPSTPANRAAGR